MKPYALDQIPFSLAGSFLTISAPGGKGSARLLYGTTSRRLAPERDLPFRPQDFFELALLVDGQEVPYAYTAQPHRLELQASGGGTATLAFLDKELLIFETEGVSLRLLPCKPYDSAVWPDADTILLVDGPARGSHQLRAGKGTQLKVAEHPGEPGQPLDWMGKPWAVDFIGKRGAFRFTRYEAGWEDKLPSIEKVLKEREKQFARWMRRMPEIPERYQEAGELAWFVLWNCLVPSEELLTRQAIYMSKSSMNAIWAWDNCFNALAVAKADPKLAWNQLRLFFDHQDPEGSLPDIISDLEVLYGFTKPPIYGWTIHKLVKRLGLKPSLPYLKELYEPLSQLTEWWYSHRDYDDDGMCQYNHGNDSGWDNATVFDQGYPIEGADLAAYLVLQNEGLSFMAKAMGKKVASLRWKVRGEVQLKDLFEQGVKDQRFVSTLNGQTEPVESESLINCVPMILGRRLPKKLHKSLAADLGQEGRFLTEFGLASESPRSPKYEADGYWRGPIWAPSTYLIFDGLVDAGEKELARTIAERYCEMCLKSGGFWENYDALSGKGLRCPGYTWTASVFLLLAEWLKKDEGRRMKEASLKEQREAGKHNKAEKKHSKHEGGAEEGAPDQREATEQSEAEEHH